VSHRQHDIGRREALVRLSSAGLALAGVGTGAVFFTERRVSAASASGIRDFRTAHGPGPAAAAAHGSDPADNVRRALAALGGMGRFVRAGETVLVKPNVGWDRLPEQGANTDPRVVAEIVREARAAGAKRVLVADISCNDPHRCFTRSGIRAAAGEAGATVLDGSEVELATLTLPGAASGLEVMRPLLEVDRVINVPVVKHHGLSRATLGMKNWMGVFGAGRNRLHQDIDRSLAELCALVRPTLTVVDATRVLMKNGPQGGSLSDVKRVEAVAVGVDPVLCDAWGAVLLGLDPRSLGFIAAAEKAGLGLADPRQVKEIAST
jgi:uncharacterized protein (DUF362 family)